MTLILLGASCATVLGGFHSAAHARTTSSALFGLFLASFGALTLAVALENLPQL